MNSNIPKSNKKRIVIVGAGFAGLKLARKINKKIFQVVLIDKNNYHQFQPLLYQVATSGLESTSISFPLRKIFQNDDDFHIRIAELLSVEPYSNKIKTTIGYIDYDFLVIAVGVKTNYFGLENIEKNSFSMKSVNESLVLRNKILLNLEKALVTSDEYGRKALLTIGIVGGGPTGVELAGTLAEMKKYILPKDYPEIDFNLMEIYLFESSERLIKTMSELSSQKAFNYLIKLGVKICLNTRVEDYDGEKISYSDQLVSSKTLIWTSGVAGSFIDGFSKDIYVSGNRIKVNAINLVNGFTNVFALGDMACIIDDDIKNGYPQLAQVAIQSAENLAENFTRIVNNKKPKEFKYKDLGTMATIGKNKAVVELPFVKFQGLFAWFVWMFVHLMAIVGIKNRFFIFINWAWNYLTWDRSYRLIYKPKYRD